MFKRTRLRIFALIAAVATVIIALMLSVIYMANANYRYERGISLLESYMEKGTDVPPPIGEKMPTHPDNRPDKRDNHNKMLRLSTFYSVFYNQNGEAEKIECDGGNLYSEQEILEFSDSILSENKEKGVYRKMPFLVRTTDRGTIVALIDNTMEMDNADRLFKNSLIVGFSAWAIVLALAFVFSKKIVNPLEQNDIRQKQFISDAGHELKTPISVISTNAELLSMELGENKWLGNIQYENERMGQLVSGLLELVRAENVSPAKERLEFSRVVSGGALPFEGVAFEKGLTLNLDIEENLFVLGNPSKLSQLVSILLDNAISHGSGGKSVGVKLTSSKNQVVLTVTNEGAPIPADIRERLFERFYRVDASRTEGSGHYGLGLAIAKAIVSAHGGKISVDCFDGLVEFKVVLSKA